PLADDRLLHPVTEGEDASRHGRSRRVRQRWPHLVEPPRDQPVDEAHTCRVDPDQYLASTRDRVRLLNHHELLDRAELRAQHPTHPASSRGPADQQENRPPGPPTQPRWTVRGM